MDDSQIRVIEALANGVDPTTGETLATHSPYNSPEVIRALFALLNEVKPRKYTHPKPKKSIDEKRADNLARGLPGNAGLPWDEEQRQRIASAFAENPNIAELAQQFGRSRGAISSELKRQGLINDDGVSDDGTAADGHTCSR